MTLRGFSRGGHLNIAIAPSILGVAIFQIVLELIGSYIDGTWHMPSPAKGLFAHFGAWATMVTDPLLMLSAAYGYRQFRLAMWTLPVRENGRVAIRRLMLPHLAFLQLRRKGIFVYAFFVCVGSLAWLNNLVQTHDPLRYFGHDIFDSTAHIGGFTAHKFTLLTSWLIVYPAVGFLNVSMCFSTHSILKVLRQKALIVPRVTHPDGCYGLAELGRLNIALLVPYFLAFVVIFSLIITHEHGYLSAEIPLVVLTIAFLTASVITIRPLLAHAKYTRHRLYRRLAMQSIRFENGGAKDLLFGIESISFALASGSPYSRDGKAILLAMRVIPITLTGFKIYHDHFG